MRFLAILGAFLAGCSSMDSRPEAVSPAVLTGTARSLGGAPLAGAFVVFGPDDNLPSARTTDEPVVVEYLDSKLVPPVVAVATGQPLVIRNSGRAGESFVIWPIKNREQNVALNAGASIKLRFETAEIAIPIKCGTPLRIQGWVHVSDHACFAMTQADGAYTMPAPPRGDYEVFAWHPRHPDKLRSARVIVGGEAATLDFTFEAPSK